LFLNAWFGPVSGTYRFLGGIPSPVYINHNVMLLLVFCLSYFVYGWTTK